MRFKATAINPKGRNKYGEYLSTGNITKKVIKTSYYGDSSNNDISGGGDGGGTIDDDHSKDDNFVLDLSTMSYDFDGSMLDVSSATKTINVIGYRGRTKADTYVGDISTMVTSDTYSISGIPESGMSISVNDNGTPYTKINITITSALTETEGVLMIPISINLKTIPGEPLDDDISAWNSNSGDCVTEVFEFDWRVLTMSVSGDIYILDLTNEAATINCDADGHVLPGAARPHCKAILYHGISAMTSGVTFSITTPVEQNVQGVAIDNDGNLTFASNFDFDGTDLEITVIANYSLVTRGAIMTVSKVKPGADGTPATSYWLVLSANAVRVSNNIATPNNITAQAMMQVGEDEPTTATGVSIYYGFDTEYPSTAYPSSGVTVIISRAYISFVLKKGNVIVDGVETVPIVVNGADGVSPYRLDLSNDNASINCDSNWNILPNAYRPRCTAKLWQGSTEVTGVTYAISGASCTYSGVSIDSSTGVITLGESDSAAPFWFDTSYTAIEFNIHAYVGPSLCAAAVYTISRSIGGSDGTSGSPAVTYWMEMSHNEVKVTSAGTFTPATITITKKKQVGGNDPAPTSDGTIMYGYDTTSPGLTYSSGIPTSSGTNYITVHYIVNNVIRNMQTILILHDGKDGQSITGRQGAAIRGPFNWDRRAERAGIKWCNGSGATGTEESQFIDVILKEGTYYVCNTTYTEAGQAWSAVSSYWTSAGQTYDFVATNILLANNAKISAFTGNDIYVMSGNTVVGGIQGSGSTFCWAGSDNPSGASFKVDYDGTIHASKGEFSGYVRVPYVNYTGLTTTTTTLNGSTISGKDAGENAYIMKVGGSTSDKLILPEPTESLAGMTYRIIVGSYMELYIKGADGTAKHFNIARTSQDVKKIIARYGYIELTCMLAPFGTRGVVWAWAVTAFNGNLELYYVAITSQGSQVLFDKAINPVYGMSLVTGDTYTVNYINADNPLPSDANKSSDTLYVSRT